MVTPTDTSLSAAQTLDLRRIRERTGHRLDSPGIDPGASTHDALLLESRTLRAATRLAASLAWLGFSCRSPDDGMGERPGAALTSCVGNLVGPGPATDHPCHHQDAAKDLQRQDGLAD